MRFVQYLSLLTLAIHSGAADYDQISLTPPPVPSPAPPIQLLIQLYSGGMSGLSIPQSGAFVGFSVELSVADQILGKTRIHIKHPFINLLGNIKDRAGRAVVRFGGNSQDKATFFPQGLPGGAIILKNTTNLPSNSSTIQVGVDLLFSMASITSLVNTQWYLGVPFNDTRLGIAEYGQQLLGQALIGIQVGNEPDLYGAHGDRHHNYTPVDFVEEFGNMVQAVENDGGISNKSNLVGPSVCCNWTPEMVFDAGFLEYHASNLAYLSVEQWILTTTAINGVITNPQDVFADYLNHSSSVGLVQAYLNTSAIALQNRKPLIMMETNTASCGGFPGLSDSFGAALWGLDFSLQMAYVNFSGTMMHAGGQNASYNPFTPPPGGSGHEKQWTVGPMYYVSLIMAEVLGRSNASRVVDLFQNNHIFTPAYAIYENDSPTRVALFNFVTDPSGASNYTAQIAIGGDGIQQPNASPSQVWVRYFTAPSVASKYGFNWGGQTFGGRFESDGILRGQQQTVSINCDTSANTCSVPVPAPGFALAFLTQQAVEESTPEPPSPETSGARRLVHAFPVLMVVAYMVVGTELVWRSIAG